MSGGQIGTAVGFVAGFFLPGGPQVWAAIGGAIGGAVDPTVIEGPKVGEVPQQTSQEGIPRPIVFARSQPMAGQIIITAPPNIVTRFEKQGKSGPKVKHQIPYRTYAIGVCRGPGVVLLQAWRNGKLVFDAEDSGMAGNNAEFQKYTRWHDGSYDQMPDPDQEAKHGAGVVHAYRGTAYLSIFEENVEDNRGAMSQWMFRVGRYLSPPTGLWMGIVLPDQGIDPEDRTIYRSTSALAFGAPETRGPPNAGLAVKNLSPTFLKTSGGLLIVYNGTDKIEIYEDYTDTPLPAPTVRTIAPGIVINRIREGKNGTLLATTDQEPYYTCSGDPKTTAWVEHALPDGLEMRDVASIPSNSRWVTYAASGPDQRFFYSDEEVPGSGDWIEASATAYPSNLQGSIAAIEDSAMMLGTLDRVFRTVGGSSWTASEVDTLDVGQGLCHAIGNGMVVFADTNSTNIGISNTKGATWSTRDVGHTSQTVAYGNNQWVLSGDNGSDFFLVSNDNLATFEEVGTPQDIGTDQAFYVGFVEPPINYKDSFYPLQSIVQEIADGVNAGDHISTTGLGDLQCRGFTVTNRYPAYKALESLSDVFFFTPYNADGKMRFKRMGGDSVATILESNMIDTGDGEEQYKTRRGDTISIPRILHGVYYDVTGGLATDKQRSERPEDAKNVGEQTIQFSVTLAADEAATALARKHAMMAEGLRGELTFSLDDSWLHLTESDPIIVQDGAKMVRGVIQQVDIDDGEQRYRVVRDRQSIHTMDVEGIPAAPVTPPPTSIKGPTRLEILDIPLWRDVDDRLGFWAAISGIYGSWPGATVEMSIDGGANYPYSNASNVPAVMGSLITELADHPAEYPDEVSSCQVAISTPSALLENTDLTGLLNGRNLALIGNEIVQFASAEEVSEGVWELSYFLRGRKASGSSHHDIGERFVLLDDRVFFVPAELTWRNRTLTFRATTFDTPVEEATIEVVEFVGKNQIERAVANLAAHRDGTDVVATWIGVGRLGGGMNAAQGAYFAGFRVTLTDGTTTQVLPDQLASSITASLAAFTGPVTVRVQQRNSITGLGPASEVII